MLARFVHTFVGFCAREFSAKYEKNWELFVWPDLVSKLVTPWFVACVLHQWNGEFHITDNTTGHYLRVIQILKYITYINIESLIRQTRK